MIAAAATYATGAKGRARFVIKKNSFSPAHASRTIATAKSRSPTATIAIAKTIHGITQRIRARVSERGRRGGGSSGSGSLNQSASGGSPPLSIAILVARLFDATAVAPLSSLVLVERLAERLAREIGPQLVPEDELRVRALPQQVVRDPLLPGGADEQVRVVHLRRVEQSRELLLRVALEPPGRLDDLGTPAIVEADEQRDPAVGGRLLLRPLDPLDQLGRDPVAAADEPHPDALPVELRGLAVDPLAEHGHEAGDLLRRARPVLGRERVDGQLLDAELDGVAQPRLHDVGAGLVPRERGLPPALRPTAVSVGDDRDVARGHGGGL